MNIHPLRIGPVLREILLENDIIAQRVEDRIFPYTSKEKVPLPHIMYDGVTVDYEETKDGAVPTEVGLSLNVNTSEYMEGIEFSEEVLDVLAEHGAIVPISADCEYDSAATMFTHKLTIKVYIQ